MAKTKVPVIKLDIVCGQGQHRTYTACFAELILLNKYGPQPDYFWRLNSYADEYLRLIKLSGKLAKMFGKNKFAWYIYKEPRASFDEDIGLIIYKLRTHKFDRPEFTLEELVQIYKNFHRPTRPVLVENKEVIVKQDNKVQSELDILGDL